MISSIKESQKLFTIEGVESGQVNVKASDYLLSLPDDKQVEVLTRLLENLEADFTNLADDMNKTQLQLLIEVTKGLLSQI
jgi:hypothetical protein